MSISALKGRLLSAAELVRQGAVFADIGTDHAHLPISLIKAGKVTRAFCCDINEGPLDSARRNARDAGVEENISFIRCDGAAALTGQGITDYAICGMGGELVRDIIDRASHLHSEGTNLILQPMTRQGALREYLAREGFKISVESYSYDAGKYYVCLLASFDGIKSEISRAEAEFGSKNVKIVNKSAQIGYIKGKIQSLTKEIRGKACAGVPYDEELAQLRYATEILSQERNNSPEKEKRS